jgi:hypothetical protein
MKIVDPNSASSTAYYLILIATLFVASLGVAIFLAWWKLSFEKSGKLRPKHGKHRHGRKNAGADPMVPLRGTGRTLAELEMKK